MRRVVITGLGVVSPIGCRLDAFWKNCVAGKSGIKTVERIDLSDFPVKIGGEITDFDPHDWLERKEAKNLDPYAHFAVAAAEMAREDSNLELTNPDRVGCILGSGIGGLQEIEQQSHRLYSRGPGRVSPFFVPKMMLNAAPGNIAIRWGIRGPNFATASACTSSGHAIGVALDQIRLGRADVIFTGGTEGALERLGMAGFCSLRALSRRNDEPERASRPFDKDRDGFVLGEGAGVLVAEELEHAKKRGARIYCELIGYGMSDDGHHITAPQPEGLGAKASMRLALEDSGVTPERVTYINAHGTSTEFNDSAESRAIRGVFGDHADKLAVSSTKSMIGHLLGASGGVEAVVSALAVQNDLAPPTINYDTPDPDCDLDYVPNEARSMPMDVVLSNSFGFGGHNATVAFGKFRNGDDA